MSFGHKGQQGTGAMREWDAAALEAEILHEAEILNIAKETAQVIATRVSKEVTEWLSKRSAVTEDDLNRYVASKIQQYNADLAYVYQNRGKII